VPGSVRIEELRRRVQKDPASIAFAQLAEEHRRAGEYQDAIHMCRAGLGRYPGYLSARVTLGRALIEVGELDDAQRELEQVLRTAPDNLAAVRALADIRQRRQEPAVVGGEWGPASPGLPPQALIPNTQHRVPNPEPRVPSPGARVPDPEPQVLIRLASWLDAIVADRAKRHG